MQGDRIEDRRDLGRAADQIIVNRRERSDLRTRRIDGLVQFYRLELLTDQAIDGLRMADVTQLDSPDLEQVEPVGHAVGEQRRRGV